MFTLHVEHYKDWRSKARVCLQRAIKPDVIQWSSALSAPLLFTENFEAAKALPIQLPVPKLSKQFLALAESVISFRSQDQWTHLYRLAFTLIFKDPKTLHNPIDPDVRALQEMRKHLARDKHKMKAFVRFKQVSGLDKNEQFVAWFEPGHFILADMAPFFCKRFHNMNWCIFTPYASLHWQDKHLFYKEQYYAPLNLEDETETLWLTYYRNIFNPARLKLKAMQSEMPKKYWRNLPEAVLIEELTRAAYLQTGHMIKAGGVDSRQKHQSAKRLQAQQRLLRERAGQA